MRDLVQGRRRTTTVCVEILMALAIPILLVLIDVVVLALVVGLPNLLAGRTADLRTRR
jgi:hypothetical protein